MLPRCRRGSTRSRRAACRHSDKNLPDRAAAHQRAAHRVGTDGTHRASLRQTLARHQALSFYIWAFSLIIVVGNAVSFVMREPAEAAVLHVSTVRGVAAGMRDPVSVGRAIGRRYGDPVSGSQSLGARKHGIGRVAGP